MQFLAVPLPSKLMIIVKVIELFGDGNGVDFISVRVVQRVMLYRIRT